MADEAAGAEVEAAAETGAGGDTAEQPKTSEEPTAAVDESTTAPPEQTETVPPESEAQAPVAPQDDAVGEAPAAPEAVPEESPPAAAEAVPEESPPAAAEAVPEESPPAAAEAVPEESPPVVTPEAAAEGEVPVSPDETAAQSKEAAPSQQPQEAEQAVETTDTQPVEVKPAAVAKPSLRTVSEPKRSRTKSKVRIFVEGDIAEDEEEEEEEEEEQAKAEKAKQKAQEEAKKAEAQKKQKPEPPKPVVKPAAAKTAKEKKKAKGKKGKGKRRRSKSRKSKSDDEAVEEIMRPSAILMREYELLGEGGWGEGEGMHIKKKHKVSKKVSMMEHPGEDGLDFEMSAERVAKMSEDSRGKKRRRRSKKRSRESSKREESDVSEARASGDKKKKKKRKKSKEPVAEVKKTVVIKKRKSNLEHALSQMFDSSSSSTTSSSDVERKKQKRHELFEKLVLETEEGEESEGEVELEKKEAKKGKGKKKKKKRKKSRESAVPTEEGEPGEKKKKGKKKKKKKRKEKVPKFKTQAERIRWEEAKRLKAEAAAAKKAEEERLQLIEEKKAAMEKDKRESAEQPLRIEQLEATEEHIRELKQAAIDIALADKVNDEWRRYLICDALPNPSVIAEMNTYLDVWEKEIETTTSDQLVHRTHEVLALLDDLQQFMDDPMDAELNLQNDWNWIRTMFREHQNSTMEFATFQLLRFVETKLHRIDIPTAEFRLQTEKFCLLLFLLVQLPIPTPNPRAPAKPRIELNWPEMQVDVTFPYELEAEYMAIRGLYLKYDHISDTSATFKDPPCPQAYSKSLLELATDQWYQRAMYKFQNRVIAKKEPVEVVNDDGETVLVEPEPEKELEPGEMPPSVPWQKLKVTPSDFALNAEKESFKQASDDMRVELEEHVVNLRKYVILGGVYYLDLFHQPVQPQGMVSFEVFMTNMIQPVRLEEAPFYVGYTPPPPSDPNIRKEPEEIEEEMQLQERLLDGLIFLSVILPTDVFWLEPPIVCQWDRENKEWTTNDIFDLKYIEEKGYLTFRTGKFGPFAIASLRYPNLPYQAWEIRPEVDGTVTLQITAAILLIEFHVKDHTIAIIQLQNVPNDCMEEHIGVYYRLPKLKLIMKNCGVDVFPQFDAFHYVDGTCEKHWPMERHLYYCMAIASVCYNFTWSRWNMTMDYRNIVLQMRMYKFNKPKQLNYSMLHVTPLTATLVDCTDVSTTFSAEPIEGMKFNADLFQLVKVFSNMSTKNKIMAAPKPMISTLADLYIAVRFLSFS